ncbi:MAG: hypothetical protein JWM11_3118 [Planctomycetaceae bacterium]|nr:hypothetical protein [Planctomycetaceae bacterium]
MRITSLTLCGLLTISALALGQEPGQRRYFPLNTPLPPPGRAGIWAGRTGKASPVKFQQVQIQVPVAGQVTWYEGAPAREISMSAPAMAGLLVGPVYRLKLSNLTDLPGVELFPSIELVDRLHPPVGRELQFPVIVPFTDEELQAATSGALVVKVIYLEQPNRASPIAAERGKAIPAIHVTSRENPLEVADVHGRPLAIVRLGGRVPDSNRPEPGFFGMGAPIQILKAPPPLEGDIAVPEPKPAPAQKIETPEVEPPQPEAKFPDATTPEATTFEVKPAEAAKPNAEPSEEPKKKLESPDEKPEPEAEKTPEATGAETPAPTEPQVKASDFE